jgi:thioredoxin 1
MRRNEIVGKSIVVTDDTFGELVLKAEQPVLVDFWAVWCHPCKMIGPILEDIAAEQAGKLVVAKLDVDTSPLAAGQYGVMSIPTLILFKGGQPVERITGFRPKEKLLPLLKPHLGDQG